MARRWLLPSGSLSGDDSAGVIFVEENARAGASGRENVADYREISQAYAPGAIKGAVLINGAAAVAILSQVSNLASIRFEVTWALLLWAAGVFFGALTWLLAFISTRYEEKAEQEKQPRHRRTSNGLCMRGRSPSRCRC
jgi:hypothetical protein